MRHCIADDLIEPLSVLLIDKSVSERPLGLEEQCRIDVALLVQVVAEHGSHQLCHVSWGEIVVNAVRCFEGFLKSDSNNLIIDSK